MFRSHRIDVYSFLFASLATASVNNVSITADYSLPDGTQVFIISEVLFVSEAIVSKLHQVQEYKGKSERKFDFYLLRFFVDAQRQRDATTVSLPMVWRAVSVALISGPGKR